MGGANSKSQFSHDDYQKYIETLIHLRKEHSVSLQNNIDIYKPPTPAFPEEVILVCEQAFDENDGVNPVLGRFKQKLELRKKFHSHYISELLYVNFMVMKGLCIEQLVSRVALQYSDVTLETLIQRKGLGVYNSGSTKAVRLPSRQAATNLLVCLTEALVMLRGFGLNHGFIQPANVLAYDMDSAAPNFKLLDVGLLNTFDK